MNTPRPMREQSQKYVFAYVLALALLAGASGCATMPVHMLNSSVETYNGKDQTYQLTNSVTIGQVVHLSASFTWDSKSNAGVHTYRWELYKDDQCIKKEPARNSLFESSPWVIWLQEDTAALGKGTFRGILYLDNAVVVTLPFTVHQ